jgi:hypothetical protein
MRLYSTVLLFLRPSIRLRVLTSSTATTATRSATSASTTSASNSRAYNVARAYAAHWTQFGA